MPAIGVSGTEPMSMRMLVVACWILTFGSPSSRESSARPHGQWLVPVVTTSAPLAAVYLTMCDCAEPGA